MSPLATVNGLVQATINEFILIAFKITFSFKLNLLARFIEHILLVLNYNYSLNHMLTI